MLAELHFLRPLWLLAFIPLAAALVWLLGRRPGLRRWANVVDAHLAPHVLIGGATVASRLPAAIAGVAGSLAILALAGPAWQKLPQPVFANQNALVIVMDLSSSMNTQDIKPSRLERARFKVADLLERRTEGQTAMIVYAADAFVVTPLTDDVATIGSQLSALTPELMPSQGSRTDVALQKAHELLLQAGRKRGDVLLVSDGADPDRAGAVVGRLVADGFRVSVLGVGTESGGPVPGQGGFIKQSDGSIVIATLDSAALRAVATRGGGIYQDLGADDRDILRIGSILEAVQPTQASERELTADVWREEGPWLVLFLLPLAALVFRRGILAVVALAFFVPVMPAKAMDTSTWWSRPDQSAARALAEGDAARAAELFKDPQWQGAARYRAGDYQGSLQALGELDNIEATYNRGNALARMGRFEEAIAAYDSVLESDPQHADATFNRDLVREQMQNNSQQSDQSSDDPSEGDQGEQQPGDNQSAENQDASQQGESSTDDPSGESANEPQTGSEQDDESLASEAEQDEADAREADAGEADTGQEQPVSMAASDEPPDEAEQAVEQWLRRIPDDPGGLLRRKFLFQYRQREQPPAEQEQW
ncbi:MAG: VWA domain-containing protein [Gammaproteobacteria bacterium]|nr:VWA domain-containing protein [Gammaproteobacteria bacterium]